VRRASAGSGSRPWRGRVTILLDGAEQLVHRTVEAAGEPAAFELRAGVNHQRLARHLAQQIAHVHVVEVDPCHLPGWLVPAPNRTLSRQERRITDMIRKPLQNRARDRK
jgi:hypothetical protein